MSQNPARHLADAAEHVRAFHHASHTTATDWENPGDSYTALGSLTRLTGMLEQAVRQSVWPVLDTFERGRIRIEGGGHPDRAVRELVAARDEAMAAAAALSAAVQRMHTATGPMRLDTSGPEFADEGAHRA
ncbi:hypothetical protein [Streptomyces sp. NPDC017529]|uniref:hypothetical protein n=1 Tax=Streptomyces sp. NPDC017529 TaxID=3365000 RepID=UPI00378A3E1D